MCVRVVGTLTRPHEDRFGLTEERGDKNTTERLDVARKHKRIPRWYCPPAFLWGSLSVPGMPWLVSHREVLLRIQEFPTHGGLMLICPTAFCTIPWLRPVCF